MTHIPKDSEIETRSGMFIDVSEPDPRTVRLRDLACSSSRVCRFGGHTSRFYSVAEHAVLCSRYAEFQGWDVRTQLACLHHDAAEAYLGDIVRPLKPLLGPPYRELTELMDVAIIKALKLPFSVEALHSAQVKEADNWALMNEARYFLPSRGEEWHNQTHNWELDLEVKKVRALPGFFFRVPRPQAVARYRYMWRHQTLMGQL